MAEMRRSSVSLAQKTVRSIRLFGLLVAQLCAYSMLSALCFACPLYLFDCSGSSTLYGAVAAIAFIPGVLATPVGGILADRGRHRGVLVVLGIVLMTASLLFIPMKRSLPLAVVVVAILCVQYGIQSLLKPMLQIETVHMMGQEKVERATALVSQVTMASNILGPVVGTAVYRCSMRNRGVDVCDVSPTVRGHTQAICLIWNDRGHYDLLDMPKRFPGVDSVPGSKHIIARCVFACGYFEPCVSWVNDWCSHCCFKASRNTVILCWDY